jgi:hypothetical protein
MNKETNINPNGIGFWGLLEIVFITLKLIGIINWSWFWVLSPIWIPFAIWFVLVVVILVCAVIKGD